jgi:hypothetical protein
MPGWSYMATGVAGTLLAFGIALTASLEHAVHTLLAMTTIGCGVAFVNVAVVVSGYEDARIASIAFVVAATAFVATGFAIMRRSSTLGSVSLLSLGLACVIFAADFYTTEYGGSGSDRISGPSVILGCISLFAAGGALLHKDVRWAGVALITLGVAGAGVGAALMIDTGVIAGSAMIGAAVACACVGLAILQRSVTLGGFAIIGLGIACLGGAVAFFREGNILQCSAAGGIGMAFVGLGVTVERHGTLLGASRRLISSLVRDPLEHPIDRSTEP